jgi:peptidoglycan/xylan/chitin deacetylase (PgdA/CDA1 family)
MRRRLVMGLLVALAVLGLASALGWLGWSQPRFLVDGVAELNPDVLFQVETAEKVVALTIDDGPHRAITPRVLDLLRERGVHATFFVLGDNIAGHEDLLARMRAEGHEIGNHLVEDRPSVLLPAEEFERQLLAVDPWVDAAAPHRWLRPGSGWFTPGMVELAAAHGYRICLGSIFPHDDRILEPQRLADDVLGRVHPGAIIVLHDGKDERVRLPETLRLVLDGLAARGYRVGTVSDLVARRAGDQASSCPRSTRSSASTSYGLAMNADPANSSSTRRSSSGA